MFFRKVPKKIGLYYYKCANAGDIVNSSLIYDLFGIKVELESFTSSDMISIGSVLERIVSGSITGKRDKELQSEADVNKKIIVWGTGFMYAYDDYSKMNFIRPAKILAVRGELTRKACEKITGKKIKCVTADPGILAPFLLDKMPEKKYKIGIIPHFREYEVEEYLEQYKKIGSKYNNSVIINLGEEPTEVLKKIASCETIMSTSLHGLIFADSLGVPSLWCEFTDKVIGKGYKFRDYYSAYGLTAEPFDLHSEKLPTVEDIKNNYKIKHSDVIRKQEQLIKCFPYQNKRTKALIKSLRYGGFCK